uniref:Tectonic family member 1 n=1 Tax=Crocodylus porosus TaxID=8502 RepID=A0A7M4F3X0_CROPO
MAAVLQLGALLLLLPLPLPAGRAEPVPSAEPPWLPRASPPAAAPLTDVAKLCVCNLLVAQCDINCCCDPDCSAADFSLFTTCSVPIVTGDSQLCSREAAIYSIDVTAHPPERIFKLIDQLNPNIFCIQIVNYKQALSFIPPETPTAQNFDHLLEQFGGAAFSAESDILSTELDAQSPFFYSNETYGVPIQTADAFLRLPSPTVSSQCSDANPAGFLVNQATKCSRMINTESCGAIQELGMLFYTSSQILVVNITVQSITFQSLNGTRTLLNSTDAMLFPMFLEVNMCTNIVIGASYLLTYKDTGEITEAAVSFVLGIINSTVLSVQQSFEISFTQLNTKPIPLSGNPGYSVGYPVRSTNEYGQLTILRSTSNQDCLAIGGARTPVLFGYNMISGCKLRITANTEYQFLAQTVLNVLKGQSFPEYVASFGNSQPQDVLDWVPITYIHSSEHGPWQLPISFEIEVKWTKYGSLINPQAKIISVTASITSSPVQTSPHKNTLQITSSVTFIDVSAPAEPGYKAQPTIEAKLPFDFFFPFV